MERKYGEKSFYKLGKKKRKVKELVYMEDTQCQSKKVELDNH